MLVVEDNLSTASDETVLLEDFERDRVDTSPACAAFADAAGVSVPDPSSDVVILSSGLCQICIIHKVNCVLQCGHALCSACLFTLLKTRKFVDDSERAMRALCSFCRTEISFFVMKDEPPEKLCFFVIAAVKMLVCALRSVVMVCVNRAIFVFRMCLMSRVIIVFRVLFMVAHGKSG